MRTNARCVLVALALSGALLSGCGQSALVDTALNGDLPTLRQEIEQSRKDGDLDRGTVEDLARAVAQREVHSAKPEFAVARVRQTRSCARQLSSVLDDRAEKNDDAGAEATLALIEAGLHRSSDHVSKYKAAESGAWRAVAARSSLGRDHGAQRRGFIADGDVRVRRNALRAALERPDGGDLAVLLEAARLDPDDLSRSLAARASGAVGGEKAVLGLKDLWARADETTRLTLVEAWSMPGSFATGGERELLKVAETSDRLPAIAAAGALVRGGGPLAELGIGLLHRVAREGAYEEKRLAFQLVPEGDKDIVEVLEEAMKEEGDQLKTIAAARLLRDSAKKSKALKLLRKLSKKEGPGQDAAIAALAAARDDSVLPLLQKFLKSGSPAQKQSAASGLTYLGRWDHAASALADENPWVRVQVACSILIGAPDPED